MTYVLGVNCGTAASHDPSACLVDGDGMVLAFIEEERLTRVRHAPGAMPLRAVQRCLELAGLSANELDVVAVGWDEPRLRARVGRPWEFDSPREFLSQLGLTFGRQRPDLQFVPHHRAHAASAFYASPYDQAAVLVVDGNGEDESISIFRAARGEPLRRLATWPRAASLGYMYEAASAWLGLGHLGAGKTMGLAAFGRARGLLAPGWHSVEGDNLRAAVGTDASLDYDELLMLWTEQIVSFAGVAGPAMDISRLDADPSAVAVAWAAQATVETVMPWLASTARRLAGEQELCIAGGVGLNCAANGRLPNPLYVPPVPHDAGVALGAAWMITPPPASYETFVPFTGGEPGCLPADDNITALDLDPDLVSKLLERGEIVAICRGRSEVGPRALCHRSLLASPTDASMKDRMNALKRREPWRPFGPVTNADTDFWDSAGELERYMIGAVTMTSAGMAEIPGAAHVDRTTRPQRLQGETFVDTVLTALQRAGHPPVLINTSFNGPGEPLVETAADAVTCSRSLGIKYLVVDDLFFDLS